MQEWFKSVVFPIRKVLLLQNIRSKNLPYLSAYQLQVVTLYKLSLQVLSFYRLRWPPRGELGNQHSRSAWTTTTGGTSSRQTKATTGTPISPQHPPALVHLPPCSASPEPYGTPPEMNWSHTSRCTLPNQHLFGPKLWLTSSFRAETASQTSHLSQAPQSDYSNLRGRDRMRFNEEIEAWCVSRSCCCKSGLSRMFIVPGRCSAGQRDATSHAG